MGNYTGQAWGSYSYFGGIDISLVVSRVTTLNVLAMRVAESGYDWLSYATSAENVLHRGFHSHDNQCRVG